MEKRENFCYFENATILRVSWERPQNEGKKPRLQKNVVTDRVIKPHGILWLIFWIEVVHIMAILNASEVFSLPVFSF